MKVQSADGVKGVLIFASNRFYFRVYDDEHNFVDYDIYHSDLTVRIVDPDAYFYHNGGKDILDHSPATLGLKI